jgi:hypothetical protein
MSKREEIYGSLTREQQAKVWRAVREGRALADPEEAAAAVRLARQLLSRQERRGWRRLARSLMGIVAVGYLALQLVLLLLRENGSIPSWPTVLLAFYLFAHVYAWSSWPRRRESIVQAERLNLQVAESANVSVEVLGPEDRSEGQSLGQVRSIDPR